MRKNCFAVFFISLLAMFASQTYAADPSPQDKEVCFAPDEPCDTKLVNFIDSAKQSIDIAIYDINLDQLVHHLLTQSKKVKVRIVVDQRNQKDRIHLSPHCLRPALF